jgi:hypothetical protein
VPDPNTREFSHSLYSASSLDETQAAYASLLQVSLEHGADATVARFTSSDDDQGRMLIDAFSNHALFLAIEHFRGQKDS